MEQHIEQSDKQNTKKRIKKNKFNFKTHLRDFLLFVDKKLLKTTIILLVIAILLIAISISAVVTVAMSSECEGTCRDGVTIISNYWSKIQIVALTGVSGLVPYVFASVLGYIGYILNEVTDLAYIVKGYGYLLGIGLGIVPLILKLISICLITALGIYMCKTVTIGYRISSIKNMNFTNFRIKLYEVLRKDEKIKTLTNIKNVKIEKLESKKEKLNYLQILNTSLVVLILQFISVVIQSVII